MYQKIHTRIFTIIVMLLTMAILTLALMTNSVYAWDDCPKGLENDPYPGECSRYIDTDNNGICDHSEPVPEDRIVQPDELSSVEIPKIEDVQDPTVSTGSSSKRGRRFRNEPSTNEPSTYGVDNAEAELEEYSHGIETTDWQELAGIIVLTIPLIMLGGYLFIKRFLST